MATDPGLLLTQRWLQAVIVHPGTDDEAVASDEASSEISHDVAEIVLASKTLQPCERTGIYRGMYSVRLKEALGADYPGLLHCLGPERFADLVAGYVQKYPSRSYKLNRWGDRLPRYIQESEGLSQKRFLYDLAFLELAMTEVFDEQESPVLSEAEIAEVQPDAWVRARLRPIAAFRLLAFQYPVHEVIHAFKEKRPCPRIGRKSTWVVIFRRNYSLRRLDLTQPAYELLNRLAGGLPVGEAISSAYLSQREGGADDKQLYEWIHLWVSAGLFRSVEIQQDKQKARPAVMKSTN